ncbi:DEAD/DEAH box helicase family protein [Sporosarcina oncorhynchi]|uniref:DEAD/DEAH box helicase family protein n=1 Tax=Sporosarcina oncorhynchi TaxID=3056444 RepID=A0ABZ0L6Q1_9BACL|nr:DEAD/DEAH box helicase family protein [Sporosarcina sp. T2O-4]WOV88178.1 DEAD/DEAH box helicase family protein [Sporosarcina sp. T2O-4]
MNLDDYKKAIHENAYLKLIIKNHLPTLELKNPDDIITNESDVQDKVHLFTDLFRGRTDVFARKWETAEGKAGYAPVVSKGGYENLSHQAIYDHLSGKHTIGLYPMLSDDTCLLLVADFDKQNWQQDVTDFVHTCKIVDIPVYIERSRSGNGAHVWIFFSQALPARLARRLGEALLTFTRSKFRTSLSSFDRLFPSQDQLSTSSSLGNLIALPLQPQARRNGNSEFLTASFEPIQDQWLYLSAVTKVGESTIKKALHTLGFPHSDLSVNEQPVIIQAIKKNGIHIRLDTLSETVISKLKELASFSNPEFYRAKAKRLTTNHLLARIEGYDINDTHLILPRGIEQSVQELANSLNLKLEWLDERNRGDIIEHDFHGTLTAQQQDAIRELLLHDCGVLSAATGFGKTVTAAALIAERKVNTLIIVNRKQLQSQWIEQLSFFLKLPKKKIGQIGGGKNTATGTIDVAMLQTLTANGIHSAITHYGQVIFDECHHVSAFSAEQLMKMVRAKYVYGLTATPVRKDGLHPIITMQCGPIIYKTDAKAQALIRPFHHVLKERFTNYKTKSENIQHIYNEIAEDTERNQMIFDDVLLALEEGLTPLILTERVSHVNILAAMFKGFAKNIIILSGELKKKEQLQSLQKIRELTDDDELLIIATGKYIGEGFDFSRLNALFLAMPISWKGLLTQYVGRLHREHNEKDEVRVYDYIDRSVPALLNMSKKRLKGFKNMGYVRQDDKQTTTEQMKLF